MSKKILVIKAGKKLPSLGNVKGDFEDWIIAGMGVSVADVDVIAVFQGDRLPDQIHYNAVLITGSGAMVTDHEEWVEETAVWLHKAVAMQIPVLGICFGHQLLAYALGGEVADNPAGVEAGCVDVVILDEADDRLLGGIQQLMVQASHRQCVIRLPEHAVCLAKTAMDPHHAFRFGENCWGLQFHPEFNKTISRHYIQYYQADLQEQQCDINAMMQACVSTTLANQCLVRFSKLLELK